MSNSAMVVYTKISPNKNSPRNNKIRKITVHHMAGNLSIERCGDIFSDGGREASSNYGIGTDGRVGMYVEEKDRSWCSSSGSNDHQAITIEVANDGGAPDWHVSDKAWDTLVTLCVDICKRNDIKELKWTGDENGTLTCHYMFTATACPGPYLKGRMKELADTVNLKLKVTDAIIYRVQVGAYKVLENAAKRVKILSDEGYGSFIVKVGSLYKVQTGAFSKKENAEKQKKELESIGYKPFISTSNDGTIVNITPKKSIKDIAREVIQGKWGNGQARKDALTKAGYDYEAVQKEVNKYF